MSRSNSTFATSLSTNNNYYYHNIPNTTVLTYIHDFVYNLEQGNIDNCLSNSIDISKSLTKQDADLFNAIDLNLKKIAQRQLQLESENLRSRIMIQQQHQLLTTQSHEDRHTHQQIIIPTPEDASLLEKLEYSYRQMTTLLPQQTSYFGILITFVCVSSCIFIYLYYRFITCWSSRSFFKCLNSPFRHHGSIDAMF